MVAYILIAFYTIIVGTGIAIVLEERKYSTYAIEYYKHQRDSLQTIINNLK